MKKQLISIAIIVFSVTGLISATTAFAAEKNAEAVLTAAQGFYSALNTMFTGELGPMKGMQMM